MKKKIRNDIILVSLILAVSAVIFLIAGIYSQKGSAVEITINGKLYGIYRTDQEKTVDINGTNVLVISDGEVYMKSACCENNTCVKQGKISDVGESIICLPNKVAVTVTDARPYMHDTEYWRKDGGI